ncbi:DUF397 domain-containing protein [Saccharothrix texasensis]|uniref:Uncharacterized protein DUF397 n=1 Tax=Saccharothrix texasensis TaxID=103734 RepID=A0A3N1HCM0_9PSEU|nr:DUF397 domain-containing protein [Saccharothrix texasensis]ROP40231.1 uncharacterized protein DUF397 [Saccharothrix texasensis]
MDLSDIVWRKSSRSGGNNECVELAVTETGTAFRDSKAPAAGLLTFQDSGYRRFLSAIRSGSLDV